MSIATLVPDRTVAQRMAALEHANAHRFARAAMKRDLKARRMGLPGLVGLLLDPPEWMASMKTYDALMAIPKVGRVKVNRMLARCGISPSKSVGGLSPRQREALVAALGGER